MNLIIYKPPKICRIEALRTASTFAMALIVSNIFNIQEGYWITFSIAVLYFAGAYHGFVLRRLNRRIIAIILGLIFGIFFLTLLSFQTYWYLYLSSIFFFFGFYSYFLSRGNYFYLAFFLAVYFLLIAALQNPPTQNMNLANLIFSRFSCTIFAVIIIIFCDILIFPRSTKPKLTTMPIARSIAADFREMVEIQNKAFISHRKNRDAAWNRIYDINLKISRLEELAKHITNELCFDEINEERYIRLFKHLGLAREELENMIFISNHFTEEALVGNLLVSCSKLTAKELLGIYILLKEKPLKESSEFLYLKSCYFASRNIERVEKQIELIERAEQK